MNKKKRSKLIRDLRERKEKNKRREKKPYRKEIHHEGRGKGAKRNKALKENRRPRE